MSDTPVIIRSYGGDQFIDEATLQAAGRYQPNAGGGGGTLLSISGTPANATVGDSPVFTPTIAGGTAPYTLSLFSGTMPNGRSISGLSVTGTYTTAGTFNYTLRVTDAIGGTANLPVSVVISAAASLTLADKGFPAAFRTGGGTPIGYVESTPGVFTTNYSDATYQNTGTMYYVSTTGNDANDGLSTGAAKRTIQSAIDAAPTGSQITVAAGRGYGSFIVPTGKSLSIIGPAARDAFVGELVSNAEVSSWGTLASGRQTVTLASGTLAGFVDLTLTRRQDRQGRATPHVSRVVATAAEIATVAQANVTDQKELALYGTPVGTAAPIPGIFLGTNATIGAADGRDLTSKADTDLLMWRTTAAAPFTVQGTGQLFAKNMTFVGGAESFNAVGARAVLSDCRILGCTTQPFGSDGVSILHNTTVRGCYVSDNDLVDYTSGSTASAIMAEVGCFMDQCSGFGADNCSTHHGGIGLRINGTYLDASRCWNDVTSSLIAGIGCTLSGNTTSTARSLAFGGGEAHYAAITFIDASPASDMMFNNTSSLPTTRAYVYDGSFAGKTQGNATIGAQFNITPISRDAAKPTADTTFVDFDLSMANLFQDTAGTVPVTAVGQNVQRINNIAGAGEYATFPASTYTYQLDGTKPVLRQSGAAQAGKISFFLTTTVFDESSNILFGIKSSDTSGYLFRLRLTNGFVYTSGTSSTLLLNTVTGSGAGTTLAGFSPRDAAITVDGSNTPITLGSAFRTAALNGAPHVVRVGNANISYIEWMRMPDMLLQFDGDLYGLQISRNTNGTALRAREQVMADKTGATLV